MANRQQVRPEEGEQRFGAGDAARPGVRGALYVMSGAKTGAAGNPACIILDSCDTNGTVKTWVYWPTSSGVLRYAELGASAIASVITNETSSGTAV